MIQSELKKLLNFYNNLDDKENEETIKMLLVKDVLHILGYKKEWFKCEVPNMLGKSDIMITPPDNDIIYIETKPKNYKIAKKDYSQLSGYMDATNTEWGILTNGNHYYLLNKSINAKAEERVILEYLLSYDSSFKYSKKQNDLNIKYFSYKQIFKKQSTKHFAYYREYAVNNKSNTNSMSCRQYQSANFNFFDYLDTHEKICDNYLLNPTILKMYFEDIATTTKRYSSATLINKCNYIVATLKYLEERGTLQTKYFSSFNSEKFLADIIDQYCDNNQKTTKLLTIEEANSLLEYYSKNKANYSRNKLIFKLYLFICPSIERILNLKLSNFSLKNNNLFLHFENCTVKLPSSMINDYNEYLNWRESNLKNKKSIFLFYTLYDQQINKMTSSTIMYIINNSFNHLDISEERKKELNISMIQKSVITNMLKNGFSIEQISLFSNLSPNTIYSYMNEKTIKLIAQKTTKDLLSLKHPYAELL